MQVRVLHPAPVSAVLAQLVRAPACHAGGQGFDPPVSRQFKFREVAEPVDAPDSNPDAERHASSSLALPTREYHSLRVWL